MNFAVALTGNKVRGAQVDLTPLVGTDVMTKPELALERVEAEFIAGQVSDATRATLEQQMQEPRITGAKLDDPVKQVNVALITGAGAGLARISETVAFVGRASACLLLNFAHRGRFSRTPPPSST